ncbi:flagellar type III secretion system pore protein FliP [Noviherbaspirillum sp. 17J57-3]|uniref:Flagellar biosynthetic protein FliP n=2 Tax=Noviherbaspirillum galbum TaxID=2709383 RepID=A0A6B3SVV8_9BURK|nr:flagellar type III secretion system pore protein FliP [Noviherbaspirillum galbum]
MVAACAMALMLFPALALAANADNLLQLPGVQVRVGGAGAAGEMSSALHILLALTVLSLAPAILICMTSFVRIVIVLSMLRHALGMQETPPNTVIVSLALFLTVFSMSAPLEEIRSTAYEPFVAHRIGTEEAAAAALKPIRGFMVRQTREQDLALMVELAHAPQPRAIEDIGMLQLVPAFMLSELRTAFQIGFVIFLPFLLVDLVVSAALMSLGMMMVPPASIALPLKILMFVLMDGWNLVARSLLGTFH